MKTITNIIVTLFTFCIMNTIVNAQSFEYTQSIKGRIVDKQTNVPLFGASVFVMEDGQPKGTISDNNGYFILPGVKTGRVTLYIQYIGYNSVELNNLNLTTGKELQFDIELEEQVQKIDEVVIARDVDKTESVNKMTSISARTFSIEESQRYAGARNDVARMAANFAGVSSSNDALNDIVIRGNSSAGLLWQLEEMEIPNPNHFGQIGASGGPVGMINNNVLSNSDFLTGAFPAEYGNATSGVFDLKMRNGNYDKTEFLGQVGFNGFEVGIEGPIPVGINSSYLFNYRYSTLGLMADMGMNFGTGTAIPYYQDLSFKINIPTLKAGRFTVFGLGGKSNIHFENSENDTTEQNKENMYSEDFLDINSKSKMGVVGLSHSYIINPTTYSKFIVGLSSIQNENIVDTILTFGESIMPYVRSHNVQSDITLSYYINKKLNSQHNLRVGVKAKNIYYNLQDSVMRTSLGRFVSMTNSDGNTWLYETYLQWQYKLNDNLVFNPGIHYQQLALNSKYSIEPRFGMKWMLPNNNTISLGYGIHSKPHPLAVYCLQTELDEPGTYEQTNKTLGFTRSQHYVIGYNKNFSKILRFKAEVYYQDILETAVETSESPYSILNTTSFSRGINDSLVNGGDGYNYGLELTLEKFLDKGFYYLFTVSLFESKYKGSDGIERNTAFNGNYVFNVLAGKEFYLSGRNENAKTKKYLTIDGKVTLAGGQRYTPLDLDKSVQQNATILDDEKAFSKKMDDYFRADLRIGYRMDGKKLSQEWAFDIQNVTDHKNPYTIFYNTQTGEEKMIYQLGFFPMMQYRITF